MKRSLVCLILVFLPAALIATTHSPDENSSIMIKVLRAKTGPLQTSSSTVYEGCGQADYSPSCMHAAEHFVQNMMVVQSEDGKKFTIACTIENKWSNCIPLPVGEAFRAQVGKDGLSVFYLGSKGQLRKQHYRVSPEASFDAPPVGN